MLRESEVAAWWRRKGGDKVRSDAQQNSVRLGFGFPQTLARKAGTGHLPALFSPAAWPTSPALGMSRNWGPPLPSPSPNLAEPKQALASLGTVHWYIRFHHQISSLQLHWCFILFLLLQLTESNSKKGYSILLNWHPLVTAMLFKRDTLLACYFPFRGTLIFTSLRRYFVHTQNKTGLCNFIHVPVQPQAVQHITHNRCTQTPNLHHELTGTPSWRKIFSDFLFYS